MILVTVWLTQQQMAELFQVDKSGISRRLKNIFETGELSLDLVVAGFATTAADGKTYQVEHYNLDVIISVDPATALQAIKSEFSTTVEEFERDFPSLCFAIATGVGKTRLMGAFISYLHQAEGIFNISKINSEVRGGKTV